MVKRKILVVFPPLPRGTFARSFTLWSHAHRVGTTFALDWSKAREARDRPRGFNLNFCLKQRVETKNKNKSKRWKKLRLANYYTINYFFIFTLPSLCTKAYPF